MTTTAEPFLSIGEVSALTGLTTHTLRFYEPGPARPGPVIMGRFALPPAG